jgi:hypothetical protein
MKAKICGISARYFGLKVEVITPMENCSLIGFHGPEFIVATADLATVHRLSHGKGSL